MGDLKARRPMRRRLGQESKAVGGPGPGPTHPAGPAASGLRPHPSPSRPALHSAHPTAIGPRLRPSVGGQPAGHRPRPEGKISPAAGRTAGAGLQRPKRRALRGPPHPQPRRPSPGSSAGRRGTTLGFGSLPASDYKGQPRPRRRKIRFHGPPSPNPRCATQPNPPPPSPKGDRGGRTGTSVLGRGAPAWSGQEHPPPPLSLKALRWRS